MMTRVALLGLALLLAGWSGAGAQMPAPPRPTPAPAPVPFRLTVNAATLAGLPRITISATDEGGHTNKYTGVSLRDLLVRAGAPAGTPVRGKAMMSYVVVSAADGYHVLFTLPELDASYTDHVVVIADQRDGAPLAAGAGPYRLIVPFEKRDAGWVRQVTAIDLQNAPAP
ncbi:MAG TPA: molybdopterin-dependent oxidoreductase [Candidatus Lustribacter sp.]